MDVYVSQAGSGRKDGSDFKNAMPIKNMTNALKGAGDGGRVLLLAGEGDYHLTGPINIHAGGSKDAPVTITGMTRAGELAAVDFTGTRAAEYKAGMAAGSEMFKIFGTADNVVFDNINFENVGAAFRVAEDVSGITIKNVSADNVAYFFYTQSSATGKSAAVSDLLIDNVDVTGFSRGVVKLTYDSHGITINDLHGDSERQDGDNFAIGVHLTGTTHDVKISNSVMENISDSTNRYWNGDGFASEGGVYNVTISDTISRGNTDSGFDLKSSDTTLIRVTAEDNARNYRIWGDVEIIDSVALDPHKRGGVGAQAQFEVTPTGHLVIRDSLVADAGSSTGVFKVDGSIEIIDTQVILADTARLVHQDSTAHVPAVDATTVPTLGYFSPGYMPPADILWHDDAAPVAPVTIEVVTGGSADGTAAADAFHIANGGIKSIHNFAADDVLILEQALYDGNKDRILTTGGDNVFNVTKTDGIAVSGVNSIRYLGTDDDGHVYGMSAVRKSMMTEGTLADDHLKSDVGDKVAHNFLYDTALLRDLGDDTIANFGRKDTIVTTAALDLGEDGRVHAGSNGFALHDTGGPDDVFALTGTNGAAIETLDHDGAVTINGLTYQVYSLVGADAGIANFASFGLV